jgi:hypothetical protein
MVERCRDYEECQAFIADEVPGGGAELTTLRRNQAFVDVLTQKIAEAVRTTSRNLVASVAAPHGVSCLGYLEKGKGAAKPTLVYITSPELWEEAVRARLSIVIALTFEQAEAVASQDPVSPVLQPFLICDPPLEAAAPAPAPAPGKAKAPKPSSSSHNYDGQHETYGAEADVDTGTLDPMYSGLEASAFRMLWGLNDKLTTLIRNALTRPGQSIGGQDRNLSKASATFLLESVMRHLDTTKQCAKLWEAENSPTTSSWKRAPRLEDGEEYWRPGTRPGEQTYRRLFSTADGCAARSRARPAPLTPVLPPPTSFPHFLSPPLLPSQLRRRGRCGRRPPRRWRARRWARARPRPRWRARPRR